MTFSSVDVAANQVEFGVAVRTPELDAELAERYGEGTVRVIPALEPVG
jgi:hypothetical protein